MPIAIAEIAAVPIDSRIPVQPIRPRFTSAAVASGSSTRKPPAIERSRIDVITRTSSEIWIRLMVLPCTIVSLSAIALVTPPPTRAVHRQPLEQPIGLGLGRDGHRLHRAEVVGLQVGGDDRVLEVVIDEVREVLLLAAHRVEQQVLRDALGRVGQLAAARAVDDEAHLLEQVDDRHDLADRQRLVGDE